MYNEDYYENGIAKGVSCYTNYSWQPEFTIPLAHRLVLRLNLTKRTEVLDYGCAKGFLVKALRLLNIPSFGCDISQYAIDNVPADVRKFCKVSSTPVHNEHFFNWIIAKDVLEHLSLDELTEFNKQAQLSTENMFIVVPLGDGKKYYIPEYEKDITHVIRQPINWWVNFFNKNWSVEASTDMRGIKDSWTHYENGNAVLTCRR